MAYWTPSHLFDCARLSELSLSNVMPEDILMVPSCCATHTFTVSKSGSKDVGVQRTTFW